MRYAQSEPAPGANGTGQRSVPWAKCQEIHTGNGIEGKAQEERRMLHSAEDLSRRECGSVASFAGPKYPLGVWGWPSFKKAAKASACSCC